MWDSWSNFVSSHFDSVMLWVQGALPFFIICGLILACAISGARKLTTLISGVDEEAVAKDASRKRGAKDKARAQSLNEATEMIDSVDQTRQALRPDGSVLGDIGNTSSSSDETPHKATGFDPAEAAAIEQMMNAQDSDSCAQFTLPFDAAEIA